MVNCSCSCNCGSGQSQKRRREEEDTASPTGRLSHFPEPILYLILSFLDTKSAVQTSILSRTWNRVWKHVPVLDLHRRSFRHASQFEMFVSKVLSLRYNLSLHSVNYVDDVAPCDEDHERRLVMVIKYALSRDVQQLFVRKSNDLERTRYRLFHLFDKTFSNYHVYNDLKTLEVRSVTLDRGFVECSGLPMLTTLSVASCLLDTTSPVLFANFRCLKYLTMSTWLLPRPRSVRGIRVHGPQLLRLELVGMEQFKIDIFAPKLEFFGLRQDVRSQGLVDEVALPALDRTKIVLTWIGLGLSKRQVEHYLNSLFRGLRNAKSLKLDRSTIQVLKKMSEFLEQQTTLFERLQLLIVPSLDLPDKVRSYFCRGSSSKVPKLKAVIFYRLFF